VFGTEKKVGNVPIGLLYAAAVLEKDYRVEVLDCETMDFGDSREVGKMGLTDAMLASYPKYAKIMGDENHPIWEEVTEDILGRGADVIGFTAQTATMSSVKYICRSLTERTDIPIMLGGPHPTALPFQSLEETGARAVVIGEGEATVLELVPALLEGSNLSEVKGIAYADGSSYSMGEPRERIQDLDALPFPARHLLDASCYKTEAFGYITSARGCPFDCVICASKEIWGRMTRFRSVDNVLNEIEEVQLTYGTEVFRFADDTFTLDRERVLRFCRKLKERGLRISFRCGSRADGVDGEMVRALEGSGCNEMSFGVESGSQRILDVIGKKQTVERARETIELVKEGGIKVIAFFILGHPTETLWDVGTTINLIEEIDAYRTVVNLMTPLPGTALFEGQSMEWWKYNFQGKSVKSVSSLSEKKLNEIYESISAWVLKKNMGEEADPPRFDS